MSCKPSTHRGVELRCGRSVAAVDAEVVVVDETDEVGLERGRDEAQVVNGKVELGGQRSRKQRRRTSADLYSTRGMGRDWIEPRARGSQTSIRSLTAPSPARVRARVPVRPKSVRSSPRRSRARPSWAKARSLAKAVQSDWSSSDSLEMSSFQAASFSAILRACLRRSSNWREALCEMAKPGSKSRRSTYSSSCVASAGASAMPRAPCSATP